MNKSKSIIVVLVFNLYCRQGPPQLDFRMSMPCTLEAEAPTPNHENAPAQQGAGGRVEDKRENHGHQPHHLEAAELVTRLVVIQVMYKSLVKRSVGTVSIESESMSLVKERLAGPTGHCLLKLDLDVELEPEIDLLGRSQVLKCWRDARLVRKLTSIRLRVVVQKLREARSVFASEMRDVGVNCSKSENAKAWDDVRRIQKKTWDVENPKHQQKVEHLTRRAGSCQSHRACREIEKLVDERWRRSIKIDKKQVSDILDKSDSMSTSSESLPGDNIVKDSIKPASPDDLLSHRYFSRPEDLARIDKEEAQLKRMTQAFNHRWRSCQEDCDGVGVVKNEEEVMTFGNVELSENERDLLSLGPGFMVVTPLDDQEMKVEADVTLTKIRWSRRKQGTDEMTSAQEKSEHVPETVEEQLISEALEAEMRDVLSNDGKDLCMGRARPTDMRTNREVMMPGPSKAMVEAEYNTRVGVWEKAYHKYKSNHCKTDGTQLRGNLTVSQQIGLKTLAKKVSSLEVIILQADKGKRFVVVDQPTYLAMGQDHVAKDTVITPEDARASQRILSSMAKSLVNVLGVGTSQSHSGYSRCMDNAASGAEDVPGMKLLPKVHKPPALGGQPQS